VYRKNFPDAIDLGDITRIDWEGLRDEIKGRILITGGFPCQDISIAGGGSGIRGLGNAIVPQAAAHIFSMLKDHLC